MNISHYPVDSNTAKLFVIQESNQSKYLQPDYFLSSSNNSFLGKKYYKIQQRVSRIVSAALLSGLVLTASVDASASSNTAVPVFPYMQDHGTPDHLTPENTFEDVVKQKSLIRRAAYKVAKRLGLSHSSLKSQAYGTSVFDQPHPADQSKSLDQPSISYDEVKAIYESEYGESIDDATSKRVERNETLADILRRVLDIRERELKKRELTNTLDTFSDTASVSSSGGISEMSSDSNSDNSDISSPDAGSMNGSFDFTTPSDDFNNIHDAISTYIPNETFATSHDTQNLEWDTDWDDSSDDSDDDTSSLYSEATNVEEYDTVYTSSSEYSDTDSEYPNSDSEYEFGSDQEHDGDATTHDMSSHNVDLPLPPLQSQEELAALNAFEVVEESEVSAPADQEDHSTLPAISETKDDAAISDAESIIDNTDLGIAFDIESDNAAITEKDDATTQTSSLDDETLLKKAEALSYISHEELRTARKVASNHIKQRMFERNMLVAVAAGDESESDQSQILGYSVWSSGALGSAKQKTSNSSNGYSSQILGGSIGADVNFENDLLIGASFSKIRNNINHASQNVTKKLDTYIASLYGTSPLKENFTLGVIGSAGFSPKPRAKLLSLESRLDYQIALPQEIKLIPNIGFKYEYERSKTYQEQIDRNVSIAHAKKSYQAFSTEIGSRVIFAPIKLADSKISTMSVTPTAHFSLERRIGSRGASNTLNVTYQEFGKTIWSGSLSSNTKTAKTSFNAGIGLIASHKNIKLELLYDHTRQKRFKAHQGMLKLKINL